MACKRIKEQINHYDQRSCAKKVEVEETNKSAKNIDGVLEQLNEVQKLIIKDVEKLL